MSFYWPITLAFSSFVCISWTTVLVSRLSPASTLDFSWKRAIFEYECVLRLIPWLSQQRFEGLFFLHSILSLGLIACLLCLLDAFSRKTPSFAATGGILVFAVSRASQDRKILDVCVLHRRRIAGHYWSVFGCWCKRNEFNVSVTDTSLSSRDLNEK